jgi:hypothetical protein
MCERTGALTGLHCRIRTGVPASTLAAIQETTSLSIRMQPCGAAVPSGPVPRPGGLRNLVGDLERPLDAAQIPGAIRARGLFWGRLHRGWVCACPSAHDRRHRPGGCPAAGASRPRSCDPRRPALLGGSAGPRPGLRHQQVWPRLPPDDPDLHAALELYDIESI